MIESEGVSPVEKYEYLVVWPFDDHDERGLYVSMPKGLVGKQEG